MKRLIVAGLFAASLLAFVHPAFAGGPLSEIQSSAVALMPAVRLNPPVSPVVNQSNCRTDLANPVFTITIPDIAYSCPVYAGSQNTLDSGAVTQISDPAIARVLADHPGGPGLLWLAGHRTAHGGAFAAVPSLADGALIKIDGATYQVVGRAYVTIRNDRVVATGEATLDSIIRPDHGGNGEGRLLLQTCDGADHRWMIYADLVAT